MAGLNLKTEADLTKENLDLIKENLELLERIHELEAYPFSFQKEPCDAPFEHLLSSNTCPTAEEEAAVHHQLEGIRKINARANDSEARFRSTRDEPWERRYRSYSRILSKVRKLHQDVLREVFLHLYALSDKFPSSVSLVCSSWRNVVLTTPHLWTKIYIKSTTIGHCQTLFERSGSVLPLTVNIHNWLLPEPIDMEWLANYIPRIERFTLTAISCIPPHISNIPIRSWPNLRDLTLRMRPFAWKTVGGKLWGPTSLSPPLTRLRLEYVGIPPSAYPLPFDTLTHLEIIEANPIIDIGDLMTLLQSCNKLQLFWIAKSTKTSAESFEDIAESPDAVTQRTTMKCLKELHIDFGRATVWFFNRIILPALLRLEMSKAIGWQDAFEALAKRSSFSLKHFGMKNCRPGDSSPPPNDTEYQDSTEVYGSKTDALEEQALTALKTSPTIETLHIFESMPIRKYLLNGLQGDTTTQQEPLGPKLKHLWIYDDFRPTHSAVQHGATEEDILSMIERRRPMFFRAMMIAWTKRFMVYSSGDPFIPVLPMENWEIYNKFQDHDYGTSVHIFF